MDICLNVSSIQPQKLSMSNQSKTAFFKPQVKRKTNKSDDRVGKVIRNDYPVNQYKDVNVIPSTKRSTKKLSSVAASIENKNQAKLSPRFSPSSANAKKGKHQLQFSVKATGNLGKSFEKGSKFDVGKSRVTTIDRGPVDTNYGPSTSDAGDKSQSIVTFVKPSKKISLKAIVAKKRVVQETKPMPEINVNCSNSEFLKQLDSIAEVDDDQNLSKEKSIPAKQTADDKTASLYRYNDAGGDKNLRSKFVGNMDNAQSADRPGGRGIISSLFGNNPEVLPMGQRFVRVVDEKVFSSTDFSDFGLHPYSVSNLEQNMQITKLTIVQQKAIPEILAGKDVMVRSQTGSGKTLAYALPIVESLHKVRPKLARGSGLRALVVVPTRELALQTYETFLKLTKPFMWIVAGYLVGGEKRKAEKARLRRGCTILVATPGRLLDHVKHTEALRLNDVQCFVLDEADRMLDLGYEKDISEIVSALSAQANLTKFGGNQPQVENDDSGYNPLALLRQNVTSKETVSPFTSLVMDDDSEEQKVARSKESSVMKTKKQKTESKLEESQSSEASPIEMVPEDGDSTGNRNHEKKKRQTILLSATLTQAVERLAGLTMENPVLVDAAQENLAKVDGSASLINEDLIVPQTVAQSYVVTPPKLRLVTLSAYIMGKYEAKSQHKMLIFMATQDMIDYHVDLLSSTLCSSSEEDDDFDRSLDVEFFKLHGSMTQKERTEIFKTFRQAESGILFCTDVAARGLNLPKVDSVVQYTGPLSATDYVHRVGRTARVGSSGTALLFLTPSEVNFVRMLESRRIRIQQESMDIILDKLITPLSRTGSIQMAATNLQNRFETMVLEDKKMHEKACKAYLSWVRFYSSYPKDMREIFDRRELHLGHYSKAFGLRDAPRKIATSFGKRSEIQEKKSYNNRLSNDRSTKIFRKNEPATGGGKMSSSGALKRVRMLNTSEFDSGLQQSKKRKKS